MTEICQKDNRHQENVVSCPCVSKNVAPPGGLEPPTFRLTAERASQLRHGGIWAFQGAFLHLSLSPPRREGQISSESHMKL